MILRQPPHALASLLNIHLPKPLLSGPPLTMLLVALTRGGEAELDSKFANLGSIHEVRPIAGPSYTFGSTSNPTASLKDGTDLVPAELTDPCMGEPLALRALAESLQGFQGLDQGAARKALLGSNFR